MELTNSLKKDLVKHLRPAAAFIASPDTSVREAIRLLQEHNTGCVVVCDARGQAVGVFTERDVLRRVIGEHVDLDSPIKDVMSRDLASVGESDAIARAIRLLHDRGLRHLPVLNDVGEPIGVLSVRRVMEYLVEHFPRAVYNLPLDSSPVADAREGA